MKTAPAVLTITISGNAALGYDITWMTYGQVTCFRHVLEFTPQMEATAHQEGYVIHRS
jgi:hypothetical protein